jgi:Nucleotidyl transferase
MEETFQACFILTSPQNFDPMKTRIRKAVFPVAGLGTRFLPATKAMPKEMLTIVDRPVIQLAVDEAREAGIEHFVFVTGRNKGVIEDHFDKQYELEDTLRLRGKSVELDRLNEFYPAAAALGLGPRRLVRPLDRWRRAFRSAAARHADSRQARLSQADDGCL